MSPAQEALANFTATDTNLAKSAQLKKTYTVAKLEETMPYTYLAEALEMD